MKLLSTHITIITVALLNIFNVSCEKNFEYEDYVFTTPENVNDGLQTGKPQEVNINIEYLESAVSAIQKGKHGEVHSMLIYRNEKLVFEEYFKGHKFQWDAPKYYGEQVDWNKNMAHSMMSCTKSFMSACIGIAIDKGFIENANQSIFDYLPEYQNLKTNKREYITIEHLLTMSSGLAWDEWSVAHGGNLTNDIDGLYLVEDPVSSVLQRGWWAVPGDFFTYNGGGMVILGEILKNASGMNMDEFSMKYLFEPLGIQSTFWTQFTNGQFDTAGSLKITPRDMLKFGATYLNNGVCNGERIISTDWVEKSSKAYNNNININIPGEDSGKNGYTYSWWTSKFSHKGQTIKMFRAGGWGGQEIMVFPELEMVLVFTGGNYSKSTTLYKLIEKYILPAVN